MAVGHPAFNDSEFMEWLFNQKKNDENIVCYRSALFRGRFFNFLHHFRSGKYFCGIAGYADLSGAMSGGLRFASGLVVANRKKIDAVFQVGDLTQDNSPVELGVYAESFSSCQPSRNTLFCRMGKSRYWQ